MKSFDSLVIVGASGSGKTTLVNGLRTPEYSSSVIIPRRFITRPPRLGDDLTENIHTDKETFTAKVAAGLINPHWERILDGGRQEQYGFELVEDNDDRLRVYSANNAFLRDINPSVEAVLRRGLVVVALSSSDSRVERLAVRSPDISEAERSKRLSDHSVDVLAATVVMECIDTTHLAPKEGQLALQGIVQKIMGL